MNIEGINLFDLPVYTDADLLPMLEEDDMAEMVESINDGHLVKVKHATTADLDVRAKNVKDNLARIKQAAEQEIERIETIQRTMRERNLPFAGQALIYLND